MTLFGIITAKKEEERYQAKIKSINDMYLHVVPKPEFDDIVNQERDLRKSHSVLDRDYKKLVSCCV
jgi:hypothetical protein